MIDLPAQTSRTSEPMKLHAALQGSFSPDDDSEKDTTVDAWSGHGVLVWFWFVLS